MEKKKWEKENLELWNSEVLKEVYAGKNFKELICNRYSKRCIIFFSSNGLYYPNTIEEFQQTIVQKDRYEWEYVSSNYSIQQYAGKVIFVRDIYKQWYVKGINSTYDTVDKIFKLLTMLTEGYEVVTVGASSGGYAAILFGIKLHAEKIYSFSGQISLETEIEDYYWLTLYRDELERSYYYSIVDMMNKTIIPVFYFYAAGCEQDVLQHNLVKNCINLYSFAFDSNIHAKTMCNRDMPWVITQSVNDLKKICNKYCNSLLGENVFGKYSVENNKETKLIGEDCKDGK